jgi:hypothetical protein
MRTERDEIDLNECIMSYIKFETEEFNRLLDYLKGLTVTDTKGMFSDIPISTLGNLLPFVDLNCIKKHADFREKVASNLTINYLGEPYVYGTGGLHQCTKPGIYESDDDYVICDWDVSSFYPNLSIQNGIIPEHLGDSFIRIYQEVYDKRTAIPKSDPMNGAFKLMLNAVYGKSGDKYSYLFDKKFMLSITLTGQLSLSMLVEMITTRITDCQMIQSNTDGITFKIKRSDLELSKSICKE